MDTKLMNAEQTPARIMILMGQVISLLLILIGLSIALTIGGWL